MYYMEKGTNMVSFDKFASKLTRNSFKSPTCPHLYSNFMYHLFPGICSLKFIVLALIRHRNQRGKAQYTVSQSVKRSWPANRHITSPIHFPLKKRRRFQNDLIAKNALVKPQYTDSCLLVCIEAPRF